MVSRLKEVVKEFVKLVMILPTDTTMKLMEEAYRELGEEIGEDKLALAMVKLQLIQAGAIYQRAREMWEERGRK